MKVEGVVVEVGGEEGERESGCVAIHSCIALSSAVKRRTADG